MKRLILAPLMLLLMGASSGGDLDNITDQGLQGTSTSPWYFNLRNNAGTEIGTATTPLRIDPTGTTPQPVSVASLPLPAGASTSALQTTGNTSVASIDTKTPALVSGRVPVDGSGVTQPISAAALPLPAGAATSAKQPALGVAGTASADVITVQGITSMTPLKVDGSGVTQPVSAAALPLPTGASTSALQTTGNTSVASIDTKTPALVSGRVPVDGSGVTQPVSGTVTANIGTTNGLALDSTVSAINGKLNDNYGSASGALRVASQVGNASGVADFGAGTTSAQTQRVVLPTDQSAIPITHLDIAPSNGSITAFDSNTSTFVGANSQNFYIGTPTAGSSANFTLSSIGCADVQVNLLGSGGTMVVETSIDGGTFWMRPAIFQPGTTNTTNSFTSPFMLHLNTAGDTNLRVRALTSWSGTGTVLVRESINPCSITIADPLTTLQGTTPWVTNISQFGGAAVVTGTGVGGAGIPRVTVSSDSSLTANQGTAAATAAAWPMKTTDGTNVAAVKAASTAAIATDPAAVVTLSPNGDQATASNQSTEITALQVIDNLPHANNVALNNGVPVMGQLDDTSTGTVTEDNVSTIRITAARAEHVNLRNNAGTELGTTAAPVIVTHANVAKASYSASIANVVVATTPTDVFTITGSATKTVRIMQVRISGTETTGTVRDFDLVKRSTADSAGTSTTVTVVPHDSSSAAGTAVVKSYTANPTLGSSVGILKSDAWEVPLANSASANAVLVWDFGLNFQEIVLRGTSEMAAINFEGVTMTGNAMNFTITWEEE